MASLKRIKSKPKKYRSIYRFGVKVGYNSGGADISTGRVVTVKATRTNSFYVGGVFRDIFLRKTNLELLYIRNGYNSTLVDELSLGTGFKFYPYRSRIFSFAIVLGGRISYITN